MLLVNHNNKDADTKKIFGDLLYQDNANLERNTNNSNGFR